jgi:hypothetical protein
MGLDLQPKLEKEDANWNQIVGYVATYSLHAVVHEGAIEACQVLCM